MNDLVERVTDYLAAAAAPWVRELGFRVTAAEPGDVTFELDVVAHLVHGGGVLCGQAIMTGMDTGMVFLMSSLAGHDDRKFTTVTVNTVFERGVPAGAGHVTFHARAAKAGRTLVFGEVDCRLPDGTRAASATTTYMWL
jgi:acyl-coenzyme A thioesterase PaaI-like protein